MIVCHGRIYTFEGATLSMTRTPPSFAERPHSQDDGHDVLADVLRAVRLTGSVYMMAFLSAPFDLLAPSEFDATSPLGRLRHISIFHLIAGGACNIQFASGETRRLHAGDIVLIPLGGQHRMWDGEAETAVATNLFAPGPFKDCWAINHGGGGEETRMVCGWVESSEFLFTPIFRSLPPFIIERLGDDELSAVMTSTVRNILELAKAAAPGSELILGRLMETLFIEVLRRHASQLPSDASGWFAALKDPIVTRVMRMVHAEPAKHWTVELLARESGTSRTVLAERFQSVMGRAPIEYVTSWRMQLAADRIRNGRDSIAVVAADVGYESEAAFNRAFKRVTGLTPGRWRAG
jgi:AraC-like DNA-binding protein